MKRAALLTMLMLLFLYARAEETAFTFDGVQKTLDDAGKEINLKQVFMSLIDSESGADIKEAMRRITHLIMREAGKVSAVLSKTAAVIFSGALIKKAVPDGKGGKTAVFIINFCVFYTLFVLTKDLYFTALDSMKIIGTLADTMTPVLTALLALTGGTRSAALLTPMGAFASGLMSDVLIKGGASSVTVLLALSMSEAFGGLKLTRLRGFISSVFRWLTGACLGVFLAFMTTGGLIAGAYDGTFVKGAKYLTGSLIPIVGSEIAGRMDSLVSGAQLVRNAAGVTGLIALASVGLVPILKVLVCAWGLKLISAMAECVCEEETVKLLEGLAGIFMCLIALMACACAMIVILIGATIGMGNRFAG